MQKLDDQWCVEAHALSNSAIGFKIKRLLHSEQTPDQRIDMYETVDWGNLMVLDDCFMLTSRDNFFYHEMMSHPAMYTHPRVKRVVIIGGGAVGLETALLLARQGTLDEATLYFLMFNRAESPETIQTLLYRGVKTITVLERLSKMGEDIGPSTRWAILQDLSRLGVRTLTKALAKQVTARGVVIERGGSEELVPGETVVLAAGAEPVNSLADQVKGRVPEVYLIGDAKSPRKALEAVAEGLAVGRMI